MKEGGAQRDDRRRPRQRFRNALVVAEMALAVVLLVGAGLMLRTLWSLQRIDLGFNPSGVLTMRISLPEASVPQPGTGRRLLLAPARSRRRDLPGVAAAGAARSLPLGSTIGDFGLSVDGYVPPPGTNAKGDWQIVTAGYSRRWASRCFAAAAIERHRHADTQLVGADQRGDGAALLGRTRSDRRPLPYRHAPRSPVGHRRRHRQGRAPQRRHRRRQGKVLHSAHAVAQVARQRQSVAMTLVVRTRRRAVGARTLGAGRDPPARSEPAGRRRADDGRTWWARRCRRRGSRACCCRCSRLLALTLSAVGIYGVLSYVVSRRTREIGIRVAIGADRGQVLRMVLGSGLSLALTGIAAGSSLALVLTRLLRGLLHGVTAADPRRSPPSPAR